MSVLPALSAQLPGVRSWLSDPALETAAKMSHRLCSEHNATLNLCSPHLLSETRTRWTRVVRAVKSIWLNLMKFNTVVSFYPAIPLSECPANHPNAHFKGGGFTGPSAPWVSH